MTNIISKCRDILGITYKNYPDIFEYSSSKIFTLTYSNVVASSIVVYKNGALWSASNYTYDATRNKITVTGALVANDSLEINYNYYPKYSDTEIQGYIRGALYYLTINKYKTFKVSDSTTIFPKVNEAEESLIALIASILMTPSLISYRTPEITIEFVEKDTKEEKIFKAISNFQIVYGLLDYHMIDKPSVDLL